MGGLIEIQVVNDITALFDDLEFGLIEWTPKSGDGGAEFGFHGGFRGYWGLFEIQAGNKIADGGRQFSTIYIRNVVSRQNPT
jgi:hypothetical protein